MNKDQDFQVGDEVRFRTYEEITLFFRSSKNASANDKLSEIFGEDPIIVKEVYHHPAIPGTEGNFLLIKNKNAIKQIQAFRMIKVTPQYRTTSEGFKTCDKNWDKWLI
jgi:hypothetical protein